MNVSAVRDRFDWLDEYSTRASVYRAGRHPGIKFDLSESALVARHVLLKNRGERLGLLRAQVDPLKVLQLHLCFTLLLQGSEDQKEIPDIHADLHTVRVILTVVGGVHQFNIRLLLRRVCHKALSVMGDFVGHNAK